MDLQQFIDDCQAAVSDSAPTRAVREIIARAVSDRAGVLNMLGTPERGGIQKIHVAADLTIINVIWAPYMTIRPHNHKMWAVIGVYGGREDNIFWRRLKDDARGRIEAAGAKSLGPSDVRRLGDDIIHSVTNPTEKLTAAIHVYGGDFFEVERSEWETEGLEERPYDIDKTLRLFEGANAMQKAV